MFSGRRKKDFKTKAKPRVGRFKRLMLFGAVFALVFNVTIGPLSANVSAASIEANQEARAAQVESASLVNSVVSSSTGHFGWFIVDDIYNLLTGFIDAITGFFEGLAQLASCVAQFVSASPTSLPLAIIACPLIELTASAMEFVQMIMSGVLVVNIFTDDQSGYIKTATSTIAGIANIGFAVIFLIIIISTAVGGEGRGVFSNYAIKKMLPKLLVMAVAINVSYYICAALADLSNIVGSSIGGLVNDVIVDTNKEYLNSFKDNASFSINPGTATADIATTIGAAAGFTNPAGPVIALVAIAVLSTVLIFQIIVAIILASVRNVFLVTLVIISPLAWVLGILPNTSKIFEKWFKYFGQMLLVYPAVMLLFAVAELTSRAIIPATGVPVAIKIPMILATMVCPIFFIKRIITSTSTVMATASKAAGKAVKTTAAVGVAAVGVAATVATGGAAAPALGQAAGKLFGSGAANAVTKGIGLSQKVGARGGGKNPFSRAVGKMGNFFTKNEGNAEAKEGADKMAQMRIKGGRSVTSDDHADMVRANKASMQSTARQDEVKIATATIQNANLPAGDLAALGRGENAGGFEGNYANMVAAQQLAPPVTGENLEKLVGATMGADEMAGLTGDDLAKQQAINSYAAEQMDASALYSKSDAANVRTGANEDGTSYGNKYNDKDSREAVIAKNAESMTAEKRAGAASGDMDVLERAIKNTGNVSAKNNLVKIEGEVRANVTLKGKLGEGDYKIDQGTNTFKNNAP
jgi:hypothetical protein